MRQSFLVRWLPLGAVLLAQATLAQQAPVAPLVPVPVAAVVPKLAVMSQEVPRVPAPSIRIVCQASTPTPPALFLFNSRILVSQQALAHISPQDIADVQVYKSAGALPGWPVFTSISGIIDVQLKQSVRVPSIPLNRLKHRLRLTGPVQFEQYGQLLPAASLRIAKADAGAITVRVVGPGNTRVVLPVGVLPPAPPLPAGAAPRVLIRGMAQQ